MRSSKSFVWTLYTLIGGIAAVNCKYVQEQFTLTWELGAPDGQSRYMIKTNGQFPGPPLLLDEDDDVEVG